MQCNIENRETTKANEIEEKINEENLSRKIDHDLKQNTKQVYILGDSNLKHVKGYSISCSLETTTTTQRIFPVQESDV